MHPAPKRIYKNIKPTKQTKLTFIESSHSLEYYCDCKIHVGEAYLVDLGRENYRVVCRIGKADLCEQFDFCHDNFMRIPCKRLINV